MAEQMKNETAGAFRKQMLRDLLAALILAGGGCMPFIF